MSNIIPTIALTVIDDEPRIRDVELATLLGMRQPLNIRPVIAANRDELEAHGVFHVAREKSADVFGRGRPGKAYYLNEPQALLICMFARTAKAAQVRKALIDVFMAYRRGQVVRVQEHRRRRPVKTPSWPAVHRQCREQAARARDDGLLLEHVALLDRNLRMVTHWLIHGVPDDIGQI